MMSRTASIFESRAASERSLTTKSLMPFAVRDGATSPDAGRRSGFGLMAGLVANAVVNLAAGLAAVFGTGLRVAVVGLVGALAAIQFSLVLSSSS
jgi:hypothetical protein